jgi:hypothetical protein
LVYFGGFFADDDYDLKIHSPAGGNHFGTKTPRIGGDYNGDGNNDLVQFHYASKTAMVYFGGPGFDQQPDYLIHDTSFANYIMGVDYVHDFANTFGDDILINQTKDGDNNYYGYSWGPVQNGKADYLLESYFMYSGMSVASGDFNNDGIVEILAGSHYDRNYGSPGGQIALYDTLYVFVTSKSVESEPQSLKIFPNPVHSTLNISFDANGNEPISIKIIDMMGKTLYADEFMPIKGKNNFRLKTSELTQGVYVLKVQQGDFLEKTKFIVTRQ